MYLKHNFIPLDYILLHKLMIIKISFRQYDILFHLIKIIHNQIFWGIL